MMPQVDKAVVEIDDEPENSILEDRHYDELQARHESAETLSEARDTMSIVGPLQRYDSNSVAIVLDLMFPDSYSPEEGISLIREIREGKLSVHPKTPIIVLSNAGGPEVSLAAKQAGANDFFPKTTNPRVVMDRLAYYLGKEKREATATCEVLEVDFNRNRVRIRVRGTDDWILERWLDLQFCPLDAQISGGSFYLDTIGRFRNYEPEYIVKSRPVDARNEEEILGRLLSPEL